MIVMEPASRTLLSVMAAGTATLQEWSKQFPAQAEMYVKASAMKAWTALLIFAILLCFVPEPIDNFSANSECHIVEILQGLVSPIIHLMDGSGTED